MTGDSGLRSLPLWSCPICPQTRAPEHRQGTQGDRSERRLPADILRSVSG